MPARPPHDTNAVTPPLLLKGRDAAAALGVSRRQVWRLASTGVLRVVRLGRAARFARTDVERLAREGVAS